MAGLSMSDAAVSRFKVLEVCCHASAIVVVALGCLVLYGWALHIDWLTSVLPGLVTMKANTALCLHSLRHLYGYCCQVSLDPKAHTARFLALAAVLIGAATFGQYLFGLNFGIDQLLFGGPKGIGTSSPGRMAPRDRDGLHGNRLGLSTVGREDPARPTTGAGARSVAGLVAMMTISAYIYHAMAQTRLFLYTQVAVHTATALLLMSSAAGRPAREPGP
jgi:hypothetical protein